MLHRTASVYYSTNLQLTILKQREGISSLHFGSPVTFQIVRKDRFEQRPLFSTEYEPKIFYRGKSNKFFLNSFNRSATAARHSFPSYDQVNIEENFEDHNSYPRS